LDKNDTYALIQSKRAYSTSERFFFNLLCVENMIKTDYGSTI